MVMPVVGTRIFLFLYKPLNEYGEAGPRILLYLYKLLNEHGWGGVRRFSSIYINFWTNMVRPVSGFSSI
jgi:hypothetical protein